MDISSDLKFAHAPSPTLIPNSPLISSALSAPSSPSSDPVSFYIPQPSHHASILPLTEPILPLAVPSPATHFSSPLPITPTILDPSLSLFPSSTLSAQQLFRFGIRIDSRHLVICLECSIVLPPKETYGHLTNNHSSRQHRLNLPSQSDFDNLLQDLSAFEPFQLPGAAILPIPGLPILSTGFACTAPHSPVPVFASLRTLQLHYTHVHSDDDFNRKTHSRPAHVQVLGEFRGHRQVIEVIPHPLPSPPQLPDRFKTIMQSFSDRVSQHPIPFHLPQNTRERSTFAFSTQWDQPLQGLLLQPLITAAETPSEKDDPQLHRLGTLVKQYLLDISNVIHELPTLVLRLLKSPDPQCVCFFFTFISISFSLF